MSKKMSSRQWLSQEPHRKGLIKILIIQPTNTINSDAKEFGYNDNLTRIQRNVSHTLGNTRGWFDRKSSWDNVTNDKVSKKHACVGAILEMLIGQHIGGISSEEWYIRGQIKVILQCIKIVRLSGLKLHAFEQNTDYL